MSLFAVRKAFASDNHVNNKHSVVKNEFVSAAEICKHSVYIKRYNLSKNLEIKKQIFMIIC